MLRWTGLNLWASSYRQQQRILVPHHTQYKKSALFMKQVAPLAWVTNFATLSTSMSSTHIITSNIISICIKNRQSHTNKFFKLYSSPYQSTCQSPCRSPHRPPCQPPWPAPQSPPLTSSIVRVSSEKSSVGIFTHQGHIIQVGSLVGVT